MATCCWYMVWPVSYTHLDVYKRQVADNVTETTRGTVLSKNGVKVSTVEHGMAAVSYTHL